MPDAGNISKVQLPDGNTYNFKDIISGYTDTLIVMDENSNTLYITSSIVNADEEEF
ncbi:MAG: hypothetical protein IJH65_04160 [Methanobrevibacter sp.]|nr:hypothetical protein [Methanobrevibacter sp.]